MTISTINEDDNQEEQKVKNNTILSINDLSVEYRTLEGTVYAVNGISLKVSKGKALGIVGETGAGKTTTVLTVLRLLPKQGFITNGEIFFTQSNLLKLPKKKMEKIRGNQISMIFQDPMSSLNPIFTVGDQIAETIKIHNKISWNEAQKKAREMLKAVEISTDRADEFPHEFSGGMIQRVMIAIALACQPHLIIADEPTTALDVTIQTQVLTLMKELKKKYNTSMIFITHDLSIVPELCEEVAVMYAGRILEKGVIQEIYNNPLHPYTIGLFDCIPDFDNPEKNIRPIPGIAPSPKTLSKGCSFYSRCSVRMDKCENNMPYLVSINTKHQVACFKFIESKANKGSKAK